VKDIYTIVIEDSKEELAIADIFYSSLKEFKRSLKGFHKGGGKTN
jgi:hypothetical protein